ncbi:hypothetical protein B0H11DRAFT_1387372 [Mycena galericulata]|nr:hypothetical protein B0H11DRAFT_764644 [Mycena galericulata]KAJ7469941.1 hypothetical protein B0H11DRAFT_1387372 [Mycena galericulata]
MGISPSTYWQAKADPAATAETSPPDIIFTAPYFLPAPSNILLIDSFSTMSGTSLGSALLYSPHGGGVAMSKSGRLRSVPADRWAAMERYVRRARECSEQLRQSSWSRPQVASCPTTVYFDLGPAEEGGELYGLSRTGHRVFEEDLFVMNGRTVPIIKRTEIRASAKMPDGSYVETMLEEMPEPITEVSPLRSVRLQRSGCFF